jgi:hypothetical protein
VSIEELHRTSTEPETPPLPTRSQVWKAFGAPTDQVGSVNDPRTTEEFGVKWNEKWVYLGDDGSIEKVVLWLRYDLAGAFEADGSPIVLPQV